LVFPHQSLTPTRSVNEAKTTPDRGFQKLAFTPLVKSQKNAKIECNLKRIKTFRNNHVFIKLASFSSFFADVDLHPPLSRAIAMTRCSTSAQEKSPGLPRLHLPNRTHSTIDIMQQKSGRVSLGTHLSPRDVAQRARQGNDSNSLCAYEHKCERTQTIQHSQLKLHARRIETHAYSFFAAARMNPRRLVRQQPKTTAIKRTIAARAHHISPRIPGLSGWEVAEAVIAE